MRRERKISREPSDTSRQETGGGRAERCEIPGIRGDEMREEMRGREGGRDEIDKIRSVMKEEEDNTSIPYKTNK